MKNDGQYKDNKQRYHQEDEITSGYRRQFWAVLTNFSIPAFKSWMQSFVKHLVGAFVRSERQRNQLRNSNSPQPDNEASDHCSAISHNGVISQGELWGDAD